MRQRGNRGEGMLEGEEVTKRRRERERKRRRQGKQGRMKGETM